MSADHGDNPNRHMAGGDPSGPSRFDIVLRGYDRRQVEDHITVLERTINRQRAEMEQARGSAGRGGPGGGGPVANGSSQEGRPGGGANLFNPPTGPTVVADGSAAARDGGLTPEMISSFTTRLQSILQAAEEEAEEVRGSARAFAHAEEQAVRARLEELERRRQAVLSELSRVRTQLDGLLSQPDPGGTAPADRGHSGAARSGSGAESAPVPTEVVRPEGSPRPAPSRGEVRPPRGEARPAPSRGDGGRPENGPDKPQTYPLPSRPSPLPHRGAAPPAVAGRPAQQPAGQAQPRPLPQPGQPGPQPSPAAHPQSKPRPTPSPRPRTAPPASNLPGKDMPAGQPGQGSRNGVHDNGGSGRGDDDGRPAFGSGAR